MKIVARVKSNGVIVGYIVEIDEIRSYISTINMKDAKPVNAIKITNGEWKAKPGYSIVTLDKDKAGLIINNRNTKIVGKPNLLYNYGFAKLSKTQQIILDKLNMVGKDKLVLFDKKEYNIKIRMIDLSALTANTGVEFSLFERPDKYALTMGTARGIYLSKNDVSILSNGKYKWVGHTHPGNNFNCLTPSDSDYTVLNKLNQKKSIIYNSVGMYYIFGEEEEI